MKQLEENLGATLFERGHRKIKLTEAGHLLHNKAEQLLEFMANFIYNHERNFYRQ